MCNTHTTGTLRKDRKGNLKELFKKLLAKGEHIWQRKRKVYVSAWKDKRPVYLITTNHHPYLVVSRNRYGKQEIKSIEIVDYNKYNMTGIDRADQMLPYYSTPKRILRWYKKVFFHIFDMIVSSASYLYVRHCDSKATLLNFRETVISSLGLTDRSDAEISKIMVNI